MSVTQTSITAVMVTLVLTLSTALQQSTPCRADTVAPSDLQSVLSLADAMQHRLSSLPDCPFSEVSAPEHSDDACNRRAENDATLTNQFQFVDQKYSAEEKTWICPDDEEITSLNNDAGGRHIYGAPTRWIVRNQSSGPVILSWLKDFNDGTGARVEVSAHDPKIIPAHHDPKAILMPGDFSSMSAFQGHLFHVREALTIGGELLPGRVLLRHRTGLIPIRNRLATSTTICPASATIDPDPHANNNAPIDTSKRTPPSVYKRCNALTIGFTNKVGCPVDLYWAGSNHNSMTVSLLPGGADNDGYHQETDGVHKDGAQCFEQFQMHLGVNPHPYSLDEWSSQIKYESSYLNHRFLARLRHDPSVIVDDITIEPGTVRDCPGEKIKNSVGSGGLGEYVPMSVGVPNDTEEEKASTFIVVPAIGSSDLRTNSSAYITMDVASNFTTYSPADRVGCDIKKSRACGTNHSGFSAPSLLAATAVSHVCI